MKFNPPLTYKKNQFYNLKALVDYENSNRNEIERISIDSARQKISKLLKTKQISNVSDSDLSNALRSKSGKYKIKFKGKIYRGYKNLYNYFPKNCDAICYSAFHRNLVKWKKNNPGKELSDEAILSAFSGTRVKLENGNRASKLRAIYEGFKNVKIGWQMFQIKVKKLQHQLTRELSIEELKELSVPRSKWVDGIESQEYLDNKNNIVSRKRFYQLIPAPKISESGWVKRIRAFKRRHDRCPNEREVIDLAGENHTHSVSKWGLYLIRNTTNDKLYIGITSEGITERFRNHKRQALTGKRPPGGIHEAIATLGIDSFRIELIESHNNQDTALQREIELIESLNSLSPNGYNLDEGGKGTKGNENPISFEGLLYKNHCALANAYKVPYSRLESRLRLGWTLEEAVFIPKGQPRIRKTVPGTNMTVSELANKYEVPMKKVSERLQQGWTWQEAVEVKKRVTINGRARDIKVGDKDFSSHQKAADYFKISISTVRKRLKLGWSIHDAFTTRPDSRFKTKPG